jgi:hypothetical protein
MVAAAQSASSTPHTTLVWIDSQEAIVARWVDGDVLLERHDSDVPGHRASIGHVRHDPGVRHGGGYPQAAPDRRRLEHLARFLGRVAAALPRDDDLLLIGPGTVREDLMRRLVTDDEGRAPHEGRLRTVTTEPSERLTDPQLIARTRTLAGAQPRRQTVGTAGT